MLRLTTVCGFVLLFGIVAMCAAQPAPGPAKSSALSLENREILFKFKARLAEIESTADIADVLAQLNKMAESIETDDQLSALMPTMVEVRSLWSDFYSQEELAVACLSLLPSVFFPSLHELYVLC
jgi:hypothetical protein